MTRYTSDNFISMLYMFQHILTNKIDCFYRSRVDIVQIITQHVENFLHLHFVDILTDDIHSYAAQVFL